MDRSAHFDTLVALEQRLLRSEVRADPAQLGALLHPSFVEIAPGGRRYSREAVIAEFRGAPPAYVVQAQDFEAEDLVDGVVLLRYRSAHVEACGQPGRFVCRTSVWQRTDAGWQLRYHQGTPAERCEAGGARDD